MGSHDTTPMMAQYHEIKAAHEGALLFYRMGDFYEMFFDDAVAAAAALDIALTKRGKHSGEDIPMCGVPVHAAEGYLLTLIRKGFRVAVCEQLESPAEAKKRGYKAVVKRDVVRLVTPGTLTEDSLLEARSHNYLACFAQVREAAALAWVDISTGALQVMSLPPVRLSAALARLAPAELILSETAEAQMRPIAEDLGVAHTVLGRAAFDSTAAEQRLCTVFNVAALDGFGSFNRAEIAAMGALVEYLDLTQKGKIPLLRPPIKESENETVAIDTATRRNLELAQTLSGSRAGSLLSVIDQTCTAAGARLLERWLASPSAVKQVIDSRLDAVTFAYDAQLLTENLRDLLRAVPDIDRALSRLSLERGGPRDLAAIRNGLAQAERVHQALGGQDMPRLLVENHADLSGLETTFEQLDAMLVAEPPMFARDGGFVAAGADDALDEVRKLRDEGRSIIASMQKEYAEKAGIAALKIKHNNVLGYFVETTATHAEKMLQPPLSDTFIHRQTTANQVRFTTVALSDLEKRIVNASDEALEIEMRLFDGLRAAVLDKAAEISVLARALARIDVLFNLAHLAKAEDWARPKVDDSRAFSIEGGRHPVVEHALRQQSGSAFIANDCDLSPGAQDEAAIWLVTGPNMSGKSTFLRQNAIVAILAQIGSYVPAKAAHIGIVSQIFSRVGASDDLARGRSTFMVEMVETAAILNQADDRALVILDEIGRGTATYDGLSIAWATLEHLHDINRARALFATHYHEMTALSGRLSGVENATVAVKEWDGDVIFLHEVQKGAADRSYGVQVAKLAGLPSPVIDRAKFILAQLEQGQHEERQGARAIINDLPLFAATPTPAAAKVEPSAVVEAVDEIMPDELTPREALDLIYRLKELREGEGGA